MKYSRASHADPEIAAILPQVPIDRMINLTQVALSISPLVLLVCKWGISESFSRDLLVQVSIHVSIVSRTTNSAAPSSMPRPLVPNPSH
jgi:hypothetical protein